MDVAMQAFEALVDYEVAEVTAAATFYLAEIYFEFSAALLDSERPAGLSEAEKVDYEMVIEEEAYPFEERAISVHEENFELLSVGVYNPWVQKSLDKLAVLMPGRYAKAEISGVDIGVERATVGDVVSYSPESGYIHRLIEGESERRDIVEADLAGSPVMDSSPCSDKARRCVNRHPRLGLDSIDHSGFHRGGRDADDPVAAHGAVALVVQEQDAEVRFGRLRRRDDAAVHVGVPPGLPHQGGAEVVQVLPGEAASGEESEGSSNQE